ncbi:MAG: HlyC/CorC family transporter [Phycisphaerales bacterium]|jgi:putative hemolysin|nr:HlyC/CorC family transporter [Phycisphaerales bacterium]
MIGLWIALAAASIASLLAALQLALITVTRTSVEEIAAVRNQPAARRRVDLILEDPAAHARAAGFVKVLCQLIAGSGMVWWVSHLREGEAVTVLDVALGVAAAGVLLGVLTVAVPTSLAAYAGPRLLYGRSLLLRVLAVSLRPLHPIAAFLDEVIRRLVGVPKADQQTQAEQEILQVVEESAETGAIGEHERQMIEAVVQFRDLTVSQVMTPRTEIEALELTNDLGSVIRTIRTIGHSRIPVYEESLDHIVGIFYVKDLMHWLAGDGPGRGGASRAFDLRSILRPAYAVPETKTVKELLRELMEKKVHIALVVDEYGGTAGLVTIEDIVEEIIGDIRDEYEAPITETPDVVLRAEKREADLDAAARILDVNSAIESLGVQIPESEDYDTVGGFIVTTLGRIPSKGETFRHESMVFTILEAKPTRVVKVTMAVSEAGADAAPGDDQAETAPALDEPAPSAARPG